MLKKILSSKVLRGLRIKANTRKVTYTFFVIQSTCNKLSSEQLKLKKTWYILSLSWYLPIICYQNGASASNREKMYKTVNKNK